MKSRCFAVLCAALLGVVPALGADWDEAGYGSLSDYLNELYKLDDNAGLTAFPVLNVPVGGRQAALSGAFSAVANDVSGIEWNPAGSATLEQTSLAFFHNNWIADTYVDGAAFAIRFGELGLGASGKCLWTPFTQYDDFGGHLSKGYYSEAVGALNVSYNFFHGYYFEGVSVGLNLKAALRSVPDYAGAEGSMLGGSGAGQSAFALLGDLGFLTRISLPSLYSGVDKNTAFALVLRNYGNDVAGDPLPTVLVAAASYKLLRPLTLSLDVAFPFYIRNFFSFDLEQSEKPSVSLGATVRVTQFLLTHVGLSIKAGGGRFTLGTELAVKNMNFYLNYALDLLTQLQPLNRVTIGLRFDLGDRGQDAKRADAEKIYLEGMQAYNEGRDEDARAAWQEALNIDKSFDPAGEALSVLEQYEQVERRINEMDAE